MKSIVFFIFALSNVLTTRVNATPIKKTLSLDSTIVVDIPVPAVSGLPRPNASEDIHLHIDGIFFRRDGGN
ncbi:hypothetical protein NP233_g1462 [Leucocoprinus birnbaumii]|uniref:Uncharacterized protein n=1 Tax=Leucocoprinus birnbaumii TaxID=56174 RepID=A0AAD5W2J0_9AGAR|nr:hypothetical protein NP233_g1462 [Leucocoprinus birnbaumii]